LKLFYFVVAKLSGNFLPEYASHFRLFDLKVSEAVKQMTEKTDLSETYLLGQGLSQLDYLRKDHLGLQASRMRQLGKLLI